MAAGLGFKDFQTGEVLTAADVDGYLMQGIWVFADATARDAAVTSPQEGNFAFLKDTNTTTYYTGSAWTNLDTTGMVNPMTTTGDTIYSSSGSTPARLGIGTAGQVLQVNSGATAPEWATPAASIPANAVDRVATSQTTSSTTYTDLTTAGPAVTVTTGTKALVIVTGNINCNSTNDRPFMSFEVSGATTIAASDINAAIANVYNNNFKSFRFSAATVVTLTAGSNTFTAKYRGDSGAIFTFLDREIFVMNLA
jgi:hypothetical protein